MRDGLPGIDYRFEGADDSEKTRFNLGFTDESNNRCLYSCKKSTTWKKKQNWSLPSYQSPRYIFSIFNVNTNTDVPLFICRRSLIQTIFQRLQTGNFALKKRHSRLNLGKTYRLVYYAQCPENAPQTTQGVLLLQVHPSTTDLHRLMQSYVPFTYLFLDIQPCPQIDKFAEKFEIGQIPIWGMKNHAWIRRYVWLLYKKMMKWGTIHTIEQLLSF